MVESKTGLSLRGNGIILVILANLAMIVMFIEIMLVPALPLMYREDFLTDPNWIPWVLSIYMLVGAVATPLAGRLGDLYGKKKVLIYIMIIYLIGLVGSGFSLDISQALFDSNNIFVLLFFRGVQGVGMGMFPLAFGIIRDTFPRQHIPVAIGIISAMFSVGISLGLVVGGWITSVAKWTDAFHAVTPFFLILAIASYFLIKDPVISRKEGRLDLPGALFLALGVLSFLLALTQGEEWGWTGMGVVSLFVLSAVMTVLFIVTETRTKDPIVRMGLFKNRGILGSNVVALLVGLAMFLMFQTLPYFLETPLAMGGHFGLTDTLTVGLYLLPSAVSQLIFGPMGGIASRRFGAPKVLVVGMAVVTMGFLVLLEFHSSFWDIALSLLVLGAGMSLSMVSMINVVVDSCPRSEFGVATGMNMMFRVVGGSIGPVLATVVMASYSVHIGPMTFYQEQGYLNTWVMGGIFAFIGLIAAVLLRPRPQDQECDVPVARPTQE